MYRITFVNCNNVKIEEYVDCPWKMKDAVDRLAGDCTVEYLGDDDKYHPCNYTKIKAE